MRMLDDPVMFEIDALQEQVDAERERMRMLIEMLSAVGVRVWFGEGEITIINKALEPPYPIELGDGYMGLGSAGN